MTTALYLIISGVLIGAGISIIWRDMQQEAARDLRVAARLPPTAAAEPEVEITISHRAEPDGATPPARRLPAGDAELHDPRSAARA